MAKIVSFFNHKGGVSKTTTAYHVAWMLSDKGYKVLMVDTDPKCRIRHFGSYAEKRVMPRN